MYLSNLPLAHFGPLSVARGIHGDRQSHAPAMGGRCRPFAEGGLSKLPALRRFVELLPSGRPTGSWQMTSHLSSEQQSNLVKLLRPTNLRQGVRDKGKAYF